MSLVIKVDHVSKEYIIRHKQYENYTALRDVIAENTKKLLKPAVRLVKNKPQVVNKKEHFFALKDVNFEVAQGDRIAIIGRNGAGKSTLLKVLSRITEPTGGRIGIKGRISCLLEVGTGFHPELTGRENIFLNGAVLGMPRSMIKRRFDEIVEFSGVEKFLDTPVKRYSSGMYVRLAFAVAAHLESEILIVDEVLAVGDVEFQKKCLGKMQDISTKEGKTVLFVSHNMQAVRSLCKTSILLNEGQIEAIGSANDMINKYLSKYNPAGLGGMEEILKKLPKDNSLEITNITLQQNDIETVNFGTHLPIEIFVEYKVLKEEKDLRILFDLVDDEDNLILRSFHDEAQEERKTTKPGVYVSRATIPANLLGALNYKLIFRGGIHNIRWCTPDEGIVVPINVSLSGLYNKAYPASTFVGKLGLAIDWETKVSNQLNRIYT